MSLMTKELFFADKKLSEKNNFNSICEAFANGLNDAGVKVVYNYPGRPASYILDEVKNLFPHIDAQDYLPNEYVAAGKGFGSSVAGQERSCVIFKDVGVNLASDHIYCLNHIGVNRGLVFIIADDPSAWQSQNEQDSRGIYYGAGLPIIEPYDADCAYYSTLISYELSEILRLPFFIRTTGRAIQEKYTTRNFSNLKSIKIPFAKDFVDIPFDAKNKWLSIFSTVEEDKEELYEKQRKLSKLFLDTNLNLVKGTGKLGIIASGFPATQLEIEGLTEDKNISLLKLATVFPLPENLILEFSYGKERILIIDQGEPLLEMLVRDLLFRNGVYIPVLGKNNGYVRKEGEFRDDDLKLSVNALKENKKILKFPPHKVLAHAPAFEKNNPFRIMVETLRDAVKETNVRPLYTADAGQASRIPDTPECADLLHMETTMGGAISFLAGGIEAYRRKNEKIPFKGIAYVGDSDFFHNAFSGICEASAKDYPILMLVVDNQGAVSTGKQSHLGMKTKPNIKELSTKKILQSIGVENLYEASVENIKDLKEKMISGIKSEHFFVIIVRL